VDDLVLVHVFEADEHVGDEELGLALAEKTFVAQVVAEVAAI
jgi:hypothetical protein